MTFVAIPDKAAGDTVTLTMWNAVKDNLNKGVLRPISHSELGASSASVTFSSIAADWVDLVVVVRGRSSGLTSQKQLRVNGDTAANYGYQYLYWSEGAPAAISAASTSGVPLGSTSDSGDPGFSTTVALVNNYAGGTHKIVTWWEVDGNTSCWPRHGSGYWASTAAITSITILTAGVNFAAGSTFTLYGISGI